MVDIPGIRGGGRPDHELYRKKVFWKSLTDRHAMILLESAYKISRGRSSGGPS
jgi:hypothetical protein